MLHWFILGQIHLDKKPSQSTPSHGKILQIMELEKILPGVLRPAEAPLDLGGVMPTWAVMPLLHEPVWDIWASAAAFCPASSYWPWAWEEDVEVEGFQRAEPPVGSMLASSSSSTFFRSSAPAQLLLTSCSACLDLLPFCDWVRSN